MIGYGKLQYVARSGQSVEWPAVGVALQKHYVSVYLSLTKKGASLLELYSGRLGEVRAGHNNFSFKSYEDLDIRRVTSLIAEAEKLFQSDLRRCILAHGGTKPLRER